MKGMHIAKKTVISMGEKIPNNPNIKLESYLSQMLMKNEGTIGNDFIRLYKFYKFYYSNKANSIGLNGGVKNTTIRN